MGVVFFTPTNLRSETLDLLQTFERLPLPTLLRPLDVSAQLRLQRAARGGNETVTPKRGTTNDRGKQRSDTVV